MCTVCKHVIVRESASRDFAPTNQLQDFNKRTDAKENQMFLIYNEIQNGATAKSEMTNGLHING
jgi:hypothetical protein